MVEIEKRSEWDRLIEFIRGKQIVVLSGAGCSTESGIPDYRGPEARGRKRNPIQYRAFITDPETRARYWARSAIGWPRFASFQPNPGHRALASLEKAGIVRGIITQNVDRLHQAAGSRNVVEIHGALDEVNCLNCQALESRDALQERILDLNPGWLNRSAELAPDGDAELPDELTHSFRVPSCLYCGGVLKPGVIFFGENVPRHCVDTAFRMLESGDVLLVVGSSLSVYSGYRFVRKAAELEMPVGIVNLGPTRGDDLAQIRINDRIGVVLPYLAHALTNGIVASSW